MTYDPSKTVGRPSIRTAVIGYRELLADYGVNKSAAQRYVEVGVLPPPLPVRGRTTPKQWRRADIERALGLEVAR